MMPDLGPYAFEVLTSFAVGLGLIGALIAVSWMQSRRAKRALERIENNG